FTDLKRGEYCAFFQPSAANEFDTSKRVRTTNIDVDFARHAARATDSNFFMLIPVAKGVKHREMLGVRHLFAVVRLQPLNCCPYAPRGSRQVRMCKLSKMSSALGNREVNAIFLPRGCLNDRKGKIVQSRT